MTLSVFKDEHLCASLCQFAARVSPLGGLELCYPPTSRDDPSVCVFVLVRHKDPELYNAFVHVTLDDEFLQILLKGELPGL